MLINKMGIEEDLEVTALHSDETRAMDPKNRVTITSLVGVLLSTYASATEMTPDRSPATVTTLGVRDGSRDTTTEATDQRWSAA